MVLTKAQRVKIISKFEVLRANYPLMRAQEANLNSQFGVLKDNQPSLQVNLPVQISQQVCQV